MENNLIPYDGVPTVGECVYWEDPDDGISSGWYHVVYSEDHEDAVLSLVQTDGLGSNLEAFAHELWREGPAAPEITLDDVLRVADTAYGDSIVLEYALGERDCGDTLAEFLAIELADTFGGDGLANAYDVAAHQVQMAIYDLQGVRDALLTASEEHHNVS